MSSIVLAPIVVLGSLSPAATAQCPTDSCKVEGLTAGGGGGAPTVIVTTTATPSNGECWAKIVDGAIECKPISCKLSFVWTVSGVPNSPQFVTMIATSALPGGQSQRLQTPLDFDPATGEYTGTNWPNGNSHPSFAPCGETTTISVSIDIESEPAPISVNSYSLACSGGCS